MQALISPLEPRHGGLRVAQVEETTFNVAEPFFWVECDETVLPDTHFYDPESETLQPIPVIAGPSQTELIAATRKKASELRLQIASVLSDMQIDALIDGNTSLATTIKTLKEGLVAVVNMNLGSYQTAEQMEYAVLAAYQQLAASAPASLRAAFKSLVP